MIKKMFNAITIAIAASALGACGGGGGGSGGGSGSTPSPTIAPTATPTTAPTQTPTATPTATTNPNGSLSINSVGSVSQRLITLSGSSANIQGDISLNLNNKTYSTTPDANGAWRIDFSQCTDELNNGEYLAQVSATNLSGQALTAEERFIVAAPVLGDSVMAVNYFRGSGNYDGWGLHLFGDAIADDDKTVWPVNRPFDCLNGDWALARVPYIRSDVNFSFVIHKNGQKSPSADLVLTIDDFGNQVWIVQGDNTLFENQSAAQSAVDSLGNASASLDLSAVSVENTASALPENWNRSANFLQIFVRSYQDSDSDGVGDIQGLINRLDYLQELGITGIWLMPVTEASDGDHGYQVVDYRDIESDYGTMADFQMLLSSAHERGIGVVIDYVVNHSSASNPLFVDANFSPDNSKRNWYKFRSDNPDWEFWNQNPWRPGANNDFYYGVFGGDLPDFNLANPEVEAYHLSNLRFWLNMGVDGFRIDAAGVLFEDADGEVLEHNPENFVFLKKMLDTINQYDNRYLVCEAPDGSAPYASEDACGNAFAFGVQWEILDSARDRQLRAGVVEQLQRSNRDRMPLFLSNHDSFAGDRPYTRFLSCTECGAINTTNVDGYIKAAASINILASNAPFTYYGEEVGMAGDNISDPSLRRPMSWTANVTNAGFSDVTPYRPPATNVEQYNVTNQKDVSASVYEHYETLYQVRKANSALFAGGDFVLQSQVGDSHLIFTRSDSDNTAAILINLSTSAQMLSVDTGKANTTFVDQVSTNSVDSNAQGTISIDVSAQGFAVLVDRIN